MEVPPIKGFIENTLIDWEGKIASEVFLPGCNFRCPYCHAAGLVLGHRQLESVPFETIRNRLVSGNGWIDGVVISGGEPTLHENLENLLREFRSLNLLVKLDTNGTRPGVLKGLIENDLVDAVAMDVKAPLDGAKYKEAAGADVDVGKISESIELLLSADKEVEFRTTVCPAFLEADDVVEIAGRISGARRYVLQGFRPLNCLDRKMNDVVPYSLDEMREILQLVKKHVPGAVIRGYAGI